MNRVCFKFFLVSLLCIGCFSCAFNAGSWGKGEISFTLPEAYAAGTERSGEVIGDEPVVEKPKSYFVKITYDDGSVVYSKEHKAGEAVIVPELVSGQYHIDIKGETSDFIFIGSAVANVTEEEESNININIQRWKKGMIKLDFSLLDKSVKGFPSGIVPEFNVSIFNSENKNVYTGKIDYNSIDSTNRFLIDCTLPVGDYTIKLSGGNPDWAYRVNKDLKVSVSDGKVFVCFVNEHEAINYFVSSKGDDEKGTGEPDSPFKTLAHVSELVKDINIPVRVTIVDNVVEDGAVTFSNPMGRVYIEGKPNSTISVKGGINIPVGTITIDNGAVISGSKKITVGSDCRFVMKGSGKVAADTAVFLQPGANIKIEDNLTSDVAAYIQMASPKNKTEVIAVYESPEVTVKPDIINNNFDKFRFVKGQNYNVKNDCLAWAVIPEGYVGIDKALADLQTGTLNNINVFVDDYDELSALGNGLKTTNAINIALDLKTNPQVSAIADTVFKGNTKLSSIVLPATINKINNNGFNGCSGLKTISFEANGASGGVAEIGDSAFVGSGLTGKLTLPASLKSIGASAFAGCSLDDISFNEGLNSIGASAFSGAITKKTAVLTFPASLTVIGDSAFENCTNITGVIFNEGLATIGNSAFKGDTALTGRLNMPSSLRSIGNYAFENTLIVGLNLNSGLTNLGEAAFRNCAELAGEVTVPGTIKNVNKEVFFGCTNLGKVVIEKGIGTIFDKAFENSGITSVILPDSLGSIRPSAFAGCKKLTGVNIPNSVWGIYDNAFKDCTALSSVSLGSALSSIGTAAFNSCSSLSSITIPASVITISSDVFTSSGVNTVTFEDRKSKWDKNSGGVFVPDGGGNVAVAELSSGASRPLSVGEAAGRLAGGGAKDIKVFVGTNEEVMELGRLIKNTPGGSVALDLRTCLNAIPEAAFANCLYLTSIKIPEGVDGIREMVFANDSGLTSVNLPRSLNVISRNAFAGCRNLGNVNFANSGRNWNLNNIFTNDKKTVTVNDSAIAAENLKSTYVQYDWTGQ